ncbi:unnamed protein product [Phytophthora fragariaefolia]|uniref:Unnamed protein product n=1 Tax=Phytophthora fragariaefolia TaxID=1490495 RepID=A0A9W6UC56_9STRA|nr:unnamed protein product [Phytophthora fragariaefolia]
MEQKKAECLELDAVTHIEEEAERLQQNSAQHDIQKRKDQHEGEPLEQTKNATLLKIPRNGGIRLYLSKLERGRIQHEQHMAALKIQTLWLRWHHEQEEEVERECIRLEQYESSVKSQQNWGLSHRRRKLAMERIRHKQIINALKIQKHWRRWHYRRCELPKGARAEGREPRTPCKSGEINLPDQQPRELRIDAIKFRSYGRCIARTMKKYLQSRRQAIAATKIEAMWKAKMHRKHYLQALELQRAKEARAYRLLISVFATKVQVCWRRWHTEFRHSKRAAVKDDEYRLIQEAKALKRRVMVVKRSLAAKRIQRAFLTSWRHLQMARIESEQQELMPEHGMPTDKGPSEELICEYPQNEKYKAEECQASVELPEEDCAHANVKMTVYSWTHRELPHILTHSMNQILFFHDVATLLQKYIRSYQRRQRLHFYFQQSPNTALPMEQNIDQGINYIHFHFHFYFKKARAWLVYDENKSTRHGDLEFETNQANRLLRLRFDAQTTRRLLQLFEPNEEYIFSEVQEVLQEIVIDTLPILQSPVCEQDNGNVRSELRYHDVEEMELPRTVKLLRHMAQHHAHVRRQQLLKVDTAAENPVTSLPYLVDKSIPSSPIGKSAPSSPSQRAMKEVTIFTAVESASVEDATFLQQRGADLAAIEPKTQRNALHMLAFSKESHRARAEMLEFLLGCDTKLDVNSVDINGDTPLMLYASLGHLEFMQKLLEHGADILRVNSKGQNVLHRACEDDQVEICGFLQQLMIKDSIAENIIPAERISALAPASLSLHTPDSIGRYPLHCLAENGFVECAKQLVVPTEASYEWNRMFQLQGDAQGRTALHLAVLTHDAAMTAFLLTPGGGSNVDAFDDLHRSPLHYAVESPAALPIIARLVQHGATVNVADERGDTPLHWAAFSGRAAVAQNLLALGADPTLVNSDWETPAQIAAAYGQLDCMRLLLQAQRRYGTVTTGETKDQALARPASEKTALQRLEEAVNHLHQRQASAHSHHAVEQDRTRNGQSTNDTVAEREAGSHVEQSDAGYWEELHQDVQLVEESGHFSSEDEEDLLFGRDDDLTLY